MPRITLNMLRDNIDQIDHQILDLLDTRFTIVRQIKEVKEKLEKSILDPDRFRNIMQDRLEFAKVLQLHPSFIEELFALIHEESIRIQTEEYENA